MRLAFSRAAASAAAFFLANSSALRFASASAALRAASAFRLASAIARCLAFSTSIATSRSISAFMALSRCICLSIIDFIVFCCFCNELTTFCCSSCFDSNVRFSCSPLYNKVCFCFFADVSSCCLVSSSFCFVFTISPCTF